MNNRKTIDEQIEIQNEKYEKAIKRINQLKAKKNELERRKSEIERKARTKRLIETGATVESVLGRPLDKDDNIRLMNFLKKQDANGNYFTNAMNEVNK